MTLDQVNAFLTLAEELHFGRAAERLYRSQSRVSRLISSLEDEVGGRLFERNSRKVRLTPLGVQFHNGIAPAHHDLMATLAKTQAAVRARTGLLRIGFTMTTEGPALTRLLTAFRKRHPESEAVTLLEVPVTDPYTPLREDQIDVLFNWLTLDEPDLVTGVAIEHDPRALAVASSDRLAHLSSVSADDLAGRSFAKLSQALPTEIQDAFYPRYTPAGKPIPRDFRTAHTMSEVFALVAQGQVVHATVASLASKITRDDIRLVPISDLPPLPLGLVWRAAAENARIRAIADTAASLL